MNDQIRHCEERGFTNMSGFFAPSPCNFEKMCYTYFSDFKSHRKLSAINNLVIKTGFFNIETRGGAQVRDITPYVVDDPRKVSL